MRKCGYLVIVSMLAMAPAAWAQRGPTRGGFGGGGLLAQESVQKELKLSDEQIKQVDQLQTKQRESFSGLGDLDREERRAKMQELVAANRKAMASILNEDQMKRFEQLSLQLRGGQALADPEVAKSLGLSSEQTGKIEDIQSGHSPGDALAVSGWRRRRPRGDA